MALSRSRAEHRQGSRGCCSIEDTGDARRAADVLGIPYYVWDLSEDFEETVVQDFLSEYAAGRTPNPCVRCNEHIKFATLMERATALGFDAVATGHYARLVGRAQRARTAPRGERREGSVLRTRRDGAAEARARPVPAGGRGRPRPRPRRGELRRAGSAFRQARFVRHLLRGRRRHARLRTWPSLKAGVAG